ncbi:hypothetical protein HZB01_00020 [Candidatus Woesearchaeota archaeon]|nr:hypothetical protein [Candidatus Woesearchaeota archaeon]
MRNTKETNADALYAFLESIGKFFEQKIKFYALGGTALTILGIKPSTLDLDFNIHSEKEYQHAILIFTDIGFRKIGDYKWITQEGFALDIFHGSYILGTQLLPDALAKSKPIRKFGNIELFVLSLEDIIISKLARGDSRDFVDIHAIFLKNKISIPYLTQRYKETVAISIIPLAKQKLLDLIEIKCKEWKIDVASGIIEEVKQWEP